MFKHNFFYIILSLLKPFIWLLDTLIPKSKRIILFYGYGGRYSGNAKYLFEYIMDDLVSTGKKEWLPKWIDTHGHIRNFIIDKYDSRYIWDFSQGDINKIKLFFLILISKVIIFTSLGDLWIYRRLLNKKKRITIELNNGITIKSGGILTPFLQNRKNFNIETFIHKKRTESYHTVSSDLERFFISACFFSDVRKIVITGEPRTDQFERQRRNKKLVRLKLIDLLGIKDDEGAIKFILYAPTHRDANILGTKEENKPAFFGFSDLNMNELTEVMEEEKWHFLIRSHGIDKELNLENLTDHQKLMNHPNVHKFSSDIVEDELEVAVAIDLVFSDYSGVYLDFLLLGTPVIFFPYDLRNYTEYRDFMFDYNLFTPGPKVQTQEEFITEVRALLSSNDYFKKERDFTRDVYFKYQNGGASERIVNLFENRLL